MFGLGKQRVVDVGEVDCRLRAPHALTAAKSFTGSAVLKKVLPLQIFGTLTRAQNAEEGVERTCF
jgi:hypothetical protein